VTIDDQNETRGEPVPPHETTVAPVEVSVAVPRYFGMTPPTLLFGMATATLAVAIVLAILAHWLAALVLAVAVLVEVALFLGVARRKPDTVVARYSARAIQHARERAAWLVQSTSMRTEAGRRLAPLRRDLLELDERRERRLRDLGAAVYGSDDESAKLIADELKSIDGDKRLKEAEMERIAETVRERLEKGRLGVQPTLIKRPDDQE
jgi:hypothetical protein